MDLGIEEGYLDSLAGTCNAIKFGDNFGGRTGIGAHHKLVYSAFQMIYLLL